MRTKKVKNYGDMPWRPCSEMTRKELDELCAGLAAERKRLDRDWLIAFGFAVAFVAVAVGPWLAFAWRV